jgi:hypothetical protein
MPFRVLCNTELAAHLGVTLSKWPVERNLLNIFVAIFIPVPVQFPPRGAVVASFGLLGAVVCMVQAPEDESVRHCNQAKAQEERGRCFDTGIVRKPTWNSQGRRGRPDPLEVAKRLDTRDEILNRNRDGLAGPAYVGQTHGGHVVILFDERSGRYLEGVFLVCCKDSQRAF